MAMKSLACLIGCGALVGVALRASVVDAETRSDSTTAHQSAAGSANLDLDEVIRRVLERNPTLVAARAAWSEARARALQAGALADPMLEVMVAPRSFGSSSVETAYRLGVMQAVPVFGQRGLRRRTAEAEARGMAWDLRSAQLD